MTKNERGPGRGRAGTSENIQGSSTPTERKAQGFSKPTAGFFCPCGEPATHKGCLVCSPSCSEHAAPCLICSAWGWFEPRQALPVRPHLRPKPVEAERAIVICALRICWTDDPERPFCSASVSPAFAAWLPCAGQA